MKIQVAIATTSLHAAKEVIRRTAFTVIGDSRGYKGGYNPSPTSHCHTRSALYIRDKKETIRDHILVLAGTASKGIVAHSYILDGSGEKVSDTFRGEHTGTGYSFGNKEAFDIVASFHVSDILRLSHNMLDFDQRYSRVNKNALNI